MLDFSLVKKSSVRMAIGKWLKAAHLVSFDNTESEIISNAADDMSHRGNYKEPQEVTIITQIPV